MSQQNGEGLGSKLANNPIVVIIGLIGAFITIYVFVKDYQVESQQPDVSNLEPTSVQEKETTVTTESIMATEPPLTMPPESLCGEVVVLDFVGTGSGQNVNSGNWVLAYFKSSPNCWYKITGAGVTNGAEANEVLGAGPFRAGDKTAADFDCNNSRYEIWAIVNGAAPDQWSRVSDQLVVVPDFCTSQGSGAGLSDSGCQSNDFDFGLRGGEPPLDSMICIPSGVFGWISTDPASLQIPDIGYDSSGWLDGFTFALYGPVRFKISGVRQQSVYLEVRPDTNVDDLLGNTQNKLVQFVYHDGGVCTYGEAGCE